ncbi:MAG TPA: hypothetical protein VIK61_00070 [Acidimicrobiia bacterium]
MDLNKLTQSEKVIAGSAIAFLIFSFFPWYGKGSYSRNGWSYFLFGIIPLLLAIIMVAQIAVSRFTETKLPDLPITWGQVHLIAGGLAAVLVLLKLIIGDKYGLGGSVLGVHLPSISLDRQFGIYLAFLASLGLAAGGFLKSREPAAASPPAA